jgi:hypothetical protein
MAGPPLSKVGLYPSALFRSPYVATENGHILLAPILNLGSIHIIQTMAEKLKLSTEFLGRVYVRGFLSVSVWALSDQHVPAASGTLLRHLDAE